MKFNVSVFMYFILLSPACSTERPCDPQSKQQPSCATTHREAVSSPPKQPSPIDTHQRDQVVPSCGQLRHRYKNFYSDDIFQVKDVFFENLSKPPNRRLIAMVFEIAHRSSQKRYYIEFINTRYDFAHPTEEFPINIGDEIIVDYDFANPPNARESTLYAYDIRCISIKKVKIHTQDDTPSNHD